MNIRFLNHSGVAIEEKVQVIFDYIGGEIPNSSLARYFFASHVHADHFHKKIFDIPAEKFFLSSDIPASKDYFPIEPNKDYHEKDFSFHCFGSTDQGVSILLELEEGNVFFAADLNDWYWDDEDTKEEMMAMEKAFRKEILKASKFPIKLLIFPVDPRLGKQYDKGLKTALELLKPKYLLPIHAWENFSFLKEFFNQYHEQVKILLPLKNNEDFTI